MQDENQSSEFEASTYKCKANKQEVEQPRHRSCSYNANRLGRRASVSVFQLELFVECEFIVSVPQIQHAKRKFTFPVSSLYGRKRLQNYEGRNFNSGNYLFTTDTK